VSPALGKSRRAALAAALLACTGCTGQVTPLSCVFGTDCVQGESCVAGQCQLGTATCPTITPTFASINAGLFQVGCGAKSNKCHGDGASAAGVSGLNLQTDPYHSLLGPSGTGQPVDPQPGRPDGLLRVSPGHAADSLLIIKLKLQGDSPKFGASMPFDNPGAICPETTAVISQWIAAGAQNN
jgi:hypothetical protein